MDNRIYYDSNETTIHEIQIHDFSNVMNQPNKPKVSNKMLKTHRNLLAKDIIAQQILNRWNESQMSYIKRFNRKEINKFNNLKQDNSLITGIRYNSLTPIQKINDDKLQDSQTSGFSIGNSLDKNSMILTQNSLSNSKNTNQNILNCVKYNKIQKNFNQKKANPQSQHLIKGKTSKYLTHFYKDYNQLEASNMMTLGNSLRDISSITQTNLKLQTTRVQPLM